MIEARHAVPSANERQRMVVGVAAEERHKVRQLVGQLEAERVAVKRLQRHAVLRFEHDVVQADRFDITVAVGLVDGVHARDQLDEVSFWVAEAHRSGDARFQITGWWRHDRESQGTKLVNRAVQIVHRSYFEGEVVQARCVGGVESKDVVVRPISPKEELATVFVDTLQAPAVVVELSLIAQVPCPESDMREFGDSNHRVSILSATTRCATGLHRAP